MNLIYVFAATKMEIGPLQRMLSRQAADLISTNMGAWHFGPNELVLFTTGIGPRRAKSSAQSALDSAAAHAQGRKPNAAMVVGLCGSLAPSLAETTIVAYTDCLSTEVDQMPQPARFLSQIDRSDYLLKRASLVSAWLASPQRESSINRMEKLRLAQSGATLVV